MIFHVITQRHDDAGADDDNSRKDYSNIVDSLALV